eukprot:TRINITY_DN3922_c0_g1_i1.p5 TRINITY_DN3922_c0_g1~~TRINITY_DN3922_c0_g1_i1.p5  ORF type:complete len:239 (-),score=22.08 TRINITY_DN3922_c0_g1_i1:1194-1910(-)
MMVLRWATCWVLTSATSLVTLMDFPPCTARQTEMWMVMPTEALKGSCWGKLLGLSWAAVAPWKGCQACMEQQLVPSQELVLVQSLVLWLVSVGWLLADGTALSMESVMAALWGPALGWGVALAMEFLACMAQLWASWMAPSSAVVVMHWASWMGLSWAILLATSLDCLQPLAHWWAEQLIWQVPLMAFWMAPCLGQLWVAHGGLLMEHLVCTVQQWGWLRVMQMALRTASLTEPWKAA